MGVAVIAVAEGEIGRAALLAFVGPVLERDLQRLLDRGGAVRCEQCMCSIHRHDPSQRFGELDDDAIAIAEHGRVSDAVRAARAMLDRARARDDPAS